MRSDAGGDADQAIPSIEHDMTFKVWNPKPLKKKIDEFRKQANDLKWDVVKVKANLRNLFTQNELSHMYGNLKRDTDKDDNLKKSIVEQSKQVGRNKVQQDVLSTQLLNPNEWKTMIVAKTAEIGVEFNEMKTKEKFTRGELEQKHGIMEATRLIEKGKWEREEDSDGDSVYVKVSKSENIKGHRKVGASIRGEKFADASKMDDMVSMLTGGGGHSSIGDQCLDVLGMTFGFKGEEEEKKGKRNNVKKRPAASIKIGRASCRERV